MKELLEICAVSFNAVNVFHSNHKQKYE